MTKEYIVSISEKGIKIKTKCKGQQSERSALVRLSSTSYEKLCGLSAMTGITLRELASACIDYCIDNKKINLFYEAETETEESDDDIPTETCDI